jgi:imidazolonepropionase-like amidohydrolase
MRSRRITAVLLFLAAPLLRADAPGVYAITGGTVHPVSGPVIPNGTVVIREGLIEAVGANAKVPADATVIDAAGTHVYPGLIDAQTSMGFTTPKSSDAASEPTPDSLALRNIKLSDDDATARRTTGVTTIVTAPTHGIFNGQSVVLNLGSGSIESRVIKSPAALQIGFNPRPTWTYPDSLMGVIAFLRQTFLDAQQHVSAREIYERSPAGIRRPEDSPALEALRPVLRREMPVVFIADSELMMRRAQTLAREFNLRIILSGARQAYQLASELKDVPVLVSVKWPVAPTDETDREDQPLRVIRDRQLAPTSPAALAKNGVTFALVSGAGKSGDFLPGIRKAVENGLSPDDALRATTLAPARIFGVERQLGSLERGKIANVVVSDKPLFEKEAKVTRVFVDGREVRLPAEEKKSEAAAGTTTAAATPIDGTWALTVRAPQGNVSIQVTLRAESGRITGTFSGERGSGDIRTGTFDGTAFDFAISANAQNEAEASDWVFRGTLSGDTMNGTVATTIGNFEFSGSRSK